MGKKMAIVVLSQSLVEWLLIQQCTNSVVVPGQNPSLRIALYNSSGLSLFHLLTFYWAYRNILPSLLGVSFLRRSMCRPCSENALFPISGLLYQNESNIHTRRVSHLLPKSLMVALYI